MPDVPSAQRVGDRPALRPVWAKLHTLLLLLLCLPGCISTQLSERYEDEGFSWETLKRDQILMTPLLDLRPSGESKEVLFDEGKRLSYAESFKQAFFKLRKDIRVFGEGGAFTALSQNKDLAQIARDVLDRKALSTTATERLVTGTQGIRFFMFFTVTAEKLERSFRRESPTDKIFDQKVYSSTRILEVKMALWDTRSNKTVWIGTQRLTPTETRTVRVPRPGLVVDTKQLSKVIDAWDSALEPNSFSFELKTRPERFPAFPGREPAFSGSFDDFALGFPIHPSEEKLIAYNSFVYHRPELAARVGQSPGTPMIRLGTSSIINNRWRWGGHLGFSVAPHRIKVSGEDHQVTELFVATSLDAEFELSREIRLVGGAYAGAAFLQARPKTSQAISDSSTSEETSPEDDKTISDSSLILWPRAQLLFGASQGFQWGPGIVWRRYAGIKESELQGSVPPAWAGEIAVAWAFRGF
jgi:hypothetical protein